MARPQMVTRTILTTKVNVLCMDVNTAEPFNREVILPRTYTDEEKLLKKVRSIVDTDTVKAVHIVDTEVVKTLYGMPEQKFIDNAEILPPRAEQEEEK